MFCCFLRGGTPRVETLGYDWEEVVKRFALVYESGLKSAASGHLCPGHVSRRSLEGTSVPFFVRAPVGGTPLCLNHGPGLQSWEALCVGWVMIGSKLSSALRLFMKAD